MSNPGLSRSRSHRSGREMDPRNSRLGEVLLSVAGNANALSSGAPHPRSTPSTFLKRLMVPKGVRPLLGLWHQRCAPLLPLLRLLDTSCWEAFASPLSVWSLRYSSRLDDSWHTAHCFGALVVTRDIRKSLSASKRVSAAQWLAAPHKLQLNRLLMRTRPCSASA